jgi:hypothetical protein
MSLSPSQFAQLAMLLLARRTASVIDAEEDEPSALRKALLVLMALTQDGQSPAAKDFTRYLVTEFAPLIEHLNHGDHPLWDRNTVGVRKNQFGEIVLAIKRPVIDALLAGFGDADPDEQQALIELVADDPEEADTAAWAMSERRYVGLFDLMGFSDVVERAGNDHAPTRELLLLLHAAARNAERMMATGDVGEQRLGRAEHVSGQLRILQFSDSILVLTKDASASSSLLVQLTGQAMFLAALHHGVILRGAIACGLMTADFDHSVFFGQPLIDAHRLEARQAWYGIALHPSANLAEDEQQELGYDDIPVSMPYPVPMKKQTEQEELCVINWPVFAESLGDLEILLRPFDGSGSMEAAKLATYHKHTLAFATNSWNIYRG